MTAPALCLVFALDASVSVPDAMWTAAVEAHAHALASPKVAAVAEAEGVALAALAFAGEAQPLVGWRSARTAADLAAVAGALREAAPRRPADLGSGTATGEAIRAALVMLDAGPGCDRKVIDVATDGESNVGEPPHLARDAAEEAGVRINAVALRTRHADPAGWARDNAVTPGGFALEAVTWEDWLRAIERKIVLEVADARP